MTTMLPIRRMLTVTITASMMIVALTWIASPGAAQTARRTYTDTLEVRVLNLEVVVSDRDGQRVPDLTTNDFTLYVDDEPVPIEYFTEVRDGSYVDTVER